MLDIKSPRDYISVVTRRRYLIIVPLILGIISSFGAALLWPPSYRSSASILIEEPEVPRDLVNSTVTSYADERIQVINQRILTTRNLTDIIWKHNLYEEERNLNPISIVIEDMRKRIYLHLIAADVLNPKSGRKQDATIAFKLAFDSRDPKTAQAVVNELVSLYLGENLRIRRQAAADTTKFLRAEAEEYGHQIRKLEEDLANFKKRHSGNLPEQTKVKFQLRDRIENELIRLSTKRQSLQERRIFVEAQLAQVDPHLGAEWDPVQRLRILQSQYTSLKSKYGANHPDAREAEREIRALEMEIGPGAGHTTLQQARGTIETELANLRKKYSEEHPDVVRLRRQLESVKASLAETPAAASTSRGYPPTNPAFIQLNAQLAAIDSEAKALERQAAILQTKLQQYEEDILAAPEIEREYLDIVRDYDNAKKSFNDVKERLTRAELGESLEAESKAERFSLIEPPSYPERPISPNRPAVLVLGIISSLIIGMGLAFFIEFNDDRVYGPRQFASVTGAPPLVVVEKIKTAEDIRRQWISKAAVAALTCAAVGAFLVGLHSLVMPLDVLWAVLERRWDVFFLDVSQG